MLHTVLFVVAAWLSFGNSSALTCHCLNNAPCHPADGSCPDGCEKGWYGPGCQVGNLALRRPAFQSSTYEQYTADNAVNGIMPPNGDTSEWNCSHTAEASTGALWWYVDLSYSEDFILKNITIVNRQGFNSEHLRNFYILYTSNTVLQPDPKTWEQCAFQKESQATTVATYTCGKGTAIARRVAVYLVTMAINKNKLALCEVYVDGYSYNASALQLLNTSTWTGCENFQMNFSTIAIVPPTYLVVQLRNDSYGNVTVIAIIRNPESGMSSVTVPVMANRTYAVSVAPETCCIGSQCLNEETLDHSKCVVGQSTPPVLVRMPFYGKYALRKIGNVINIATMKTITCTSIYQSIYCSQSDDTGKSLVTCSNNASCLLDPRFNYTCVLEVTFSDGFTQTSQKNFYISTADFSTFTISEIITCNSITLLIENITAQWDLAPSFIEFYLSSKASNNTKSYRVPAQLNGKISATFAVMSNSSYSVWAVPVTYWGIASAVSNESCADSTNCIVGQRTPVKVITTQQRQYILKTQGCCASIAVISSVQCEKAVIHNITCTSQQNEALNVVKSENGSYCWLKPITNVTCNYSVHVVSGIVEIYSQFLEIDNLTECATLETSSDSQSDNQGDNQSTPAAIGGAVAGLLVIMIFVTLVAFVYRRRKALGKEKASLMPPIIAKRDSDYLTANGNLESTDDAVYGNTVGMGIEEFERYSRNEAAIFNKFSEIRNNEGHPCAVGFKNVQKNRFKNIVPYDVNRVPISDGPCNYINASYINGYNQDKKYIATQGPIASTISDFWNMVWQEKASLIVMLTDYVEQSKKKCDRYFPWTSSDTGGISVTVKSEATFNTHSVSALNVCHNGITRVVLHCHFLAWPDKSVPEHCSHLLMFYARTRELLSLNTNKKAPMIVHCSAGVGRTGAFIALDCLLSRFLAEGRVDVDSCVLKLRDQRMNMVQTKEQYMFLHKVLLYSMQTFEFIRNSTDLQQISACSRPQFENFISKEFKILQESLNNTPDESVYMAARSQENLRKNRNPDILAPENKRPYMGAVTGSLGGYINAVYCNGCYAKNAFIATQWPLKDTITEFWELVYGRNPSCIVLLHQSPSLEEYPEFYPQPGQSLTAGPILVTSESSRENEASNAKEYELLVKLLSGNASDKETSCALRLLECKVFEFDNEIPTDLEQTTSLIMSLQLVCKQSNDRPIIVVCKDGAKFCGFFLAATNSLHRLLESNQVQVFHTIDLLKASRPQFINSLAQYRCLYQLISCSTEASTLSMLTCHQAPSNKCRTHGLVSVRSPTVIPIWNHHVDEAF